MVGKPEDLLQKALLQKEKSPRSLLDPYFDVIATLRKKNWTYNEIAQFLNEEGIQVSAIGINQFWLRRHGASKQKKTSILKKSLQSKASLSSDDQGNSKAQDATATVDSQQEKVPFKFNGLFD